MELFSWRLVFNIPFADVKDLVSDYRYKHEFGSLRKKKNCITWTSIVGRKNDGIVGKIVYWGVGDLVTLGGH